MMNDSNRFKRADSQGLFLKTVLGISQINLQGGENY